MLAGDAALDHPAEAFAGVLVDDRHDLDRAPVGGDIELEVHRPHPVGRIRGYRRRRGGGAVAFAASALRHPQPFLAPQALDLLVIDCPAFSAGIVIGGPEPPPGMILGVLAQPVPQRRVRVIGRRPRPAGGVGWRGVARRRGRRTAR